MKAPARCIVTAAALVALSVLAIGSAQAHPADDERGGPPLSRRADPARDRLLERMRAREHHTYPAPTDPRQHANPSQAQTVLAMTGAVGLSVVVVVAAAHWWRRARSRPREAI